MGLVSGGALALAASIFTLQAADPEAAAPPPQEPSLSVRQLRLGGATGRDKPSATFYVRAGKDPIKNLLLLPSDLTADDGSVIAGNQYVVAPATVAAIDPGQAVLVTVTVGPAAVSGTYKGAIRLFYQGIDPKAQVELPVEFKASPKTLLELAPHDSPLVVRRRRGWPSGTGVAEPAVFCVRQKADQAGSVGIAVVGPLDTLAPGTRPLPEGAASVRLAAAQDPAQTISLPPGAWTTVEVGLTNFHLEPGTYRGAVALLADRDSVETVPLEVTVRDHWASALLVMLLGLLLSFAATYMATTGSAQLQNFRRIDLLRARLARPWLLTSDAAIRWRGELDRLEAEPRNTAPVQAGLDRIEKEIARTQADSEAQLELLRGGRSILNRFDERSRSEPILDALGASPWVAGLSDRLDSLTRGIQEGTLGDGVAAERLPRLQGELDGLEKLGEALPGARATQDVETLPSDDDLRRIAGSNDERLRRLVAALQEKGLWPAAQQAPAAAPPSVPELVQADREHTDDAMPPGWPERLSAWFHSPRVLLPLLSRLLSILTIGLAVVMGLLTLYANKPTFGSNWVDYLGVFLWGLGSEAGRKQFSDVAPLVGALRTRLGLPAATPAPAPVTPVAG